jgi:class 3 adenylate cyclase/tetratricopeptide (TPR) repeat protein
MSGDLRCSNCGNGNPEDARFCSQCGHRLRIACQVCGTEADPGDRFCRNCGSALTDQATDHTTDEAANWPQDDLSRYLPEELLAKMRSAREGRAMEGERRTVTMLFADIQGSTSAAEQLDPEDWADIMNGAFERLIAPIYRYEGTLAQLRGDAVLAFFGAPIAHEDDPVRALRAGLEMVDSMTAYSDEVERTWGIPTHVRVGINTGLVVVGAMGSDLRVEYSALGDAINVAARMEQTAEPDTVRVTGRTLSLTNGLFETEELGGVEVKGKTDPVPSHRVLRYLGERVSMDRPDIVGRRSELDELGTIREELAAGSGHIVSIVAEAGIGKSRLIDAFREETVRLGDPALRFDQAGNSCWLAGSSRSYDKSTPFATIRDMLNRWWSTSGGPDDFVRVTEAMAAEGLDDPDVAALLAYIAGIPLSDEGERFIGALETRVLNTKANEALIAYLDAVVQRRPGLVVLEDLHWSDDLSLALIEAFMDLAENSSLFLIVTMRPYREEPSWRIREVAQRDHHHRHTGIDLRPLDMSESSSLLDSLVDVSGLTPEACQGILERAEGNPLYIEQIALAARDLGAQGLDPSVVPSSLAGLLTARLDRLEDSARYLVQIASVLGTEFDREMLSVLSERPAGDGGVTELLRRGILREVSGESARLAFAHALIQEVAYGTILKRTRRELHGRAAQHLIADDGDPATIAHHLVAADELDQAFPYLTEAGVRASRSMALADAIELLGMAIDHIPDHADPELIQRAHEALGEAYALIPDLSQSAAAYQRLYDFGEQSARPTAQVAALNRLAYATASLGADLVKAKAYLADARRIAEESHDEIGMAEYHMNACFVESLAGDLGKAVAHDEETVRLGVEQGVDSIRLNGLVRRATNYVLLLDFERGMPAVETALTEARQAGLEEAEAIVEFSGVAMVHLMRGQIEAALEKAERAYETLERYESFFQAMNRGIVGTCLSQLGRIEDALACFVDMRRVAERSHQPFNAAAGLSGMALIYATAGMIDEIPDLRDEAEGKLAGPLGEFLASTVMADFGYADLARGDFARAAGEFKRGLEASSTSYFYEKPRLLAGRALALSELGDTSEARKALEEGQSMVEEKSLGLYRALLSYTRARVLAKQDPDAETVSESLRSAQESAMESGQRLLLIEIHRVSAILARAAGRGEEAESHVRRAREAVESVAEDIADPDLRQGFLRRWANELDVTETQASM